jgi:hypothetical protein
VAGGMGARDIHDRYCVEQGVTRPIYVTVVNAWEHAVRHTSNHQDQQYLTGNKDKLFVCFNRISRAHRIALIALLYERNLVDRGYYSFFLGAHGGATFHQCMDDTKTKTTPELFSLVNAQIMEHFPEFPLRLNVESISQNVNYHQESDRQYYDTAYFSLVTETFFFKTVSLGFDEESVFFSEKTFKPIYAKHPFITLNRPYALQSLRKLGYKTFSPFFNESYDLIENDEQRLGAVVDEVERLSRLTPEEWVTWSLGIAEIVEHNYYVLHNKINHEFEYLGR